MQTRYFNFLDDDSSFTFNARLVGILEPGCYRGFERFSSNITPDWTLRLSHEYTGVVPVGLGGSEGQKRGVILTRQGVIIMEDELIELTIQPASPDDIRLDLIVCNHSFSQSPGGTPAYYSVITGTPGEQEPALLNPGRQTIVGTLAVGYGIADLSSPSVAYTPNRPELAGRLRYRLPTTVAHWNLRQNWELPQKFAGVGLRYEPSAGVTIDAATRRLTITEDTGTVFLVPGITEIEQLSVPVVRRGEVFMLRFSTACLLRPGNPGAAGALLLPAGNVRVAAGDVAQFLVLPDGSALLLALLHGDVARLNQPNRFTRMNSERVGTVQLAPAGQIGVLPNIATVQAGVLTDDGNHFVLVMPASPATPNYLGYLSAAPEGTTISLTVPTAGRPTRQVNGLPQYYAGVLPEWALLDTSATPGMATPAGTLPIRFYRDESSSNSAYTTTALTPQGTTYTFLCRGGAWWLIGSSEAAVPHISQRDRRQLNRSFPTLPYNMPTSPAGQPEELFRFSPVPGARRNYVVTVTLSAAVAPPVVSPPLALRFLRQQGGSQTPDPVVEYPFRVAGGAGDGTIISATCLFNGVGPEESIVVQLARRDGTTNYLGFSTALLVLDGDVTASA